MMRIIRSAISGYASVIQGNLDRIAMAGRSAPIARSEFSKLTFCGTISGISTGFFGSEGAGLDDEVDGAASSGAAIANWLIFAPEIRSLTLVS